MRPWNTVDTCSGREIMTEIQSVVHCTLHLPCPRVTSILSVCIPYTFPLSTCRLRLDAACPRPSWRRRQSEAAMPQTTHSAAHFTSILTDELTDERCASLLNPCTRWCTYWLVPFGNILWYPPCMLAVVAVLISCVCVCVCVCVSLSVCVCVRACVRALLLGASS